MIEKKMECTLTPDEAMLIATKFLERCRTSSKKNYEKVKSDPVLLEQYQINSRAAAKRQYERIKGDPEAYSKHLEKCRNNMRKLNERRKLEKLEIKGI